MNKISGGYYIKARCVKDSWVSNAPPIVREVWDYLLREANHTDIKYNGFSLKRGQLFRSYKDIRNDLSWNIGYRKERYHESSMKRAMKALMNERMIELTSEPRGNVITVLNYSFYQSPKNYERTGEETSERPKSEPRANQHRSAINKNDKNLKKVKKKDLALKYEKYPEWLNMDLWWRFIDLRITLKKPFKTDQGITGAINKIKNLINAGYPQIDIIQQTLDGEWQSFYEPKKITGKGELKPQTYAQAQDLEKREKLKIIKDLENKQKDESNETDQKQIDHRII